MLTLPLISIVGMAKEFLCGYLACYTDCMSSAYIQYMTY
jgi:hypothetical protein